MTLLDGVDGWLARRDQTASRFGARFDMEIDALLILALSVLAWRHDKAGEWVVISGLLRYVFVAAGAALARPGCARAARQPAPAVDLRHSDRRAHADHAARCRPPASTWIAGGALAPQLYSFLIDIVWLWRRA